MTESLSRLRWTLVALLVASTALFAVGVSAERSAADDHAVEVVSEEHEIGHHDEPATETRETLLGVDVESTPLVVVAAAAGLALAALAATRLGERAGVLTAIAIIALAWAALDVREVIHQADESRTGVALVAAAVAFLHLASAAVAGRLAGQAPRNLGPARVS
ncbi:MAG TPA: hypothetical protein VFX51_30105 [Solirubrobacteraceae bacterium]|nr:hypothetical protein [Solirubrobacteraceae bacterium]